MKSCLRSGAKTLSQVRSPIATVSKKEVIEKMGRIERVFESEKSGFSHSMWKKPRRKYLSMHY